MTGFDRTRPFNDLPLLPPPVQLETPAVLKKVIGASRALAELKGAGHVIPNQAILINSIVLQEARLSSEIENIVTTNDELYRALDDERASTSAEAREVLRYREALWHGFETLKKKPLSTRLFVEIVRLIRKTNLDVRKVPGTRIVNNRGEVVYTPPEGEAAIRDKLADLERFIHADDGLDPLVKMAVVHYQFEAIHPFTDGNGRTGRILNILFLVERGLLELPVLYLSHYIIRNRPAYYAGLRSVTEEGAWEPWVLYMLDAVEDDRPRDPGTNRPDRAPDGRGPGTGESQGSQDLLEGPCRAAVPKSLLPHSVPDGSRPGQTQDGLQVPANTREAGSSEGPQGGAGSLLSQYPPPAGSGPIGPRRRPILLTCPKKHEIWTYHRNMSTSWTFGRLRTAEVA